MKEFYRAPVTLRLTYGVYKYYWLEDQSVGWTYQIKLNFSFDGFDDHKIEDMIITGLGVYCFDNENIAKIQAKRTCRQYEEHFREELADIIKGVMFDE